MIAMAQTTTTTDWKTTLRMRREAAHRSDQDLRHYVVELVDHGITQTQIADTLGMAQSQISRWITRTRKEVPTTLTAMDRVEQCRRKDIAREQLVADLKTWEYSPRYKLTSEADDYVITPNSTDAVDYAFYGHRLISEAEYLDIFEALEDRSDAREAPTRPLITSRSQRSATGRPEDRPGAARRRVPDADSTARHLRAGPTPS